jgi:hypothetical protein
MATANKRGKVLTSSLIKSERQDTGKLIDKNHSIGKNQTKLIRGIQLIRSILNFSVLQTTMKIGLS